MKIDLTLREMELILFLINCLNSKGSHKRPLAFTIDELTLIEKLELAIKKEMNSEDDFLNTNITNLQH